MIAHSGSGSGGWQGLIFLLLLSLHMLHVQCQEDYYYSYTWKTVSPSTGSWIAVSNDNEGKNVAAAQGCYFNTGGSGNGGGYLYYSSDYGSTWSQSNSTFSCWTSIASDYSGQTVVAVIGDYTAGGVYLSNDYASAPYDDFSCTCMSADGQIMLAGIAIGCVTGPIYYSHDYGTTWVVSASPYRLWTHLACNENATFITAISSPSCGEPGLIYQSRDYGLTWVEIYSVNDDWLGLATDSTGKYIYATEFDGDPYLPGYIYQGNGTEVLYTSFPSLAPTTITPSASPSYSRAPTIASTNSNGTDTTPHPTSSPTDAPISVIATNLPWIMTITVGGAMGIFALFLHHIRSAEATIHSVPVVSTLYSMSAFACSFVSQLFFAYICFNNKDYIGYGIAWLLVRVGFAALSVWYIAWLLKSNDNSNYMNWHFMGKNQKLYGFLVCCSFFQPTLVRLLPWYSSTISEMTGGFPSYTTYYRTSIQHVVEMFFMVIVHVSFAVNVNNLLSLPIEEQISFFLSSSCTFVVGLVSFVEILLVRHISSKVSEMGDSRNKSADSEGKPRGSVIEFPSAPPLVEKSNPPSVEESNPPSVEGSNPMNNSSV